MSHLNKYIKKFHGSEPYEDRYLFYSRVKGYQGKISQEAINKRLKKYAAITHEICPDVSLNLHAHQFRHAKASHLLDDGMNVAQLSKLLGHANLFTTMVYLDITTDMEAKAMISLEDEKIRNLPRKWIVSVSAIPIHIFLQAKAVAYFFIQRLGSNSRNTSSGAFGLT